MRLTWDNVPLARWPGDGLFAAERVVVHVVVDTSREEASERARLYVDGVLRPPIPGFELGEGTTIAVADDDELVLGNAVLPLDPSEGKPPPGHSPEGRIAYAALYSVALDEAEVMENATLLAFDDDTP